MSFILDALKKSESDRQRQSGPALFEVRVAPPRNSLPVWAIGLALLLAVNLVIVAWVLLRRPAAPDQTTTAITAAPPGSQGAGAPGANATAGAYGIPNNAQLNTPSANTAMPNGAAMTAPSQASGSPQGAQTTNPALGGYPAQPQAFGQQVPSAAVPAAGTPPMAPVGQTAAMTQPAQGMGQAGPSLGGSATNAITAANDGGNEVGEKLNPDDYAPAADPAPAPFGNHVARSTASGVPLYQDVSQSARLPTLHLDLHVFAANPQQRFVMINTHKLREGDSLPDGVHVESITPEGAVLSANGTRFLLPRE
jgi:general secretion pathway protein B